MTYQEAEELGRECDLTEPEKFIRNIEIHSGNLFAYSELNAELKELYDTVPAEIYSRIFKPKEETKTNGSSHQN